MAYFSRQSSHHSHTMYKINACPLWPLLESLELTVVVGPFKSTTHKEELIHNAGDNFRTVTESWDSFIQVHPCSLHLQVTTNINNSDVWWISIEAPWMHVHCRLHFVIGVHVGRIHAQIILIWSPAPPEWSSRIHVYMCQGHRTSTKQPIRETNFNIILNRRSEFLQGSFQFQTQQLQ